MGADAWSIEFVEAPELADILAHADIDPPIEQTLAWSAVDDRDPDRRTWGHCVARRGGRAVALLTLTELVTHRVRFLWARHAPVWLVEPTPEDEAALVDHLVPVLREKDRTAVHLRLDLHDRPEGTYPPTGIIAYDHTVVIDTSLSGDPATTTPEQAGEEILRRFKSRGRRDVRKAVRESGLECADETERAGEDFEEYHHLMVETAERDGFVPWGPQTYQDMLNGLGPTHVRLYAGRVEGQLQCWSIVTLSGRLAARYYAASATGAMHRRASDRMILFESTDLALRGVTRYDLMGIGSPDVPELMGLNEFKTKFSPDVQAVASAREVPLRPLAYRAYVELRQVAQVVRGAGRS
ncbi:MAG: GNAT family N-acetyltransferase [Actinomyces sp.]|nr:GNAT family N-acetyltransferase [Actinomyces sp.]MDN6428856.1 GNAT family N-acetyltransferase [Propionibacterium sp.]MDN6566512.1 GNAT family N-acetyltransferase [Actinomyces sp.]